MRGCERECPTRGVMQWVVVLGHNHKVSLVSSERVGGIRAPASTPTLMYGKEDKDTRVGGFVSVPFLVFKERPYEGSEACVVL